MKPTKVIERLMMFAPPYIAACSRQRSRCILATVTGIDVLAEFGIEAVPVPVRTEMVNGIYAQSIAAGLAPVTAIAKGGRLLVTADESDPGSWAGHLMIGIPSRARLLDLDFQQFGRPGLRVDPAELFVWPVGTRSREFTRADGSRLAIHATNDDSYTAAKDWRTDRADLVAAIARAIRRGGK